MRPGSAIWHDNPPPTQPSQAPPRYPWSAPPAPTNQIDQTDLGPNVGQFSLCELRVPLNEDLFSEARQIIAAEHPEEAVTCEGQS
jgi:hypothetical protein